MLSVGRCGVTRLQMKVGHMDGMHCFIGSTYILVKIKSVSLYNCRTVYITIKYSYTETLHQIRYTKLSCKILESSNSNDE